MEPSTLAFIFLSMTSYFELPKDLLSAVCYVESSHQLHAMHIDDGKSSSLGVCQVKLATARMLGFKGTEATLMKANVNVYYAAKYLSYQVKRYKNAVKAIASYNTGSFKQNKQGLPVNQNYVNKVVKAWREKR